MKNTNDSYQLGFSRLQTLGLPKIIEGLSQAGFLASRIEVRLSPPQLQPGNCIVGIEIDGSSITLDILPDDISIGSAPLDIDIRLEKPDFSSEHDMVEEAVRELRRALI